MFSSALMSMRKGLFLRNLFEFIGFIAAISTFLEVVFLCKMILLIIVDLFVIIEVIGVHLSIDNEGLTTFISSIKVIAYELQSIFQEQNYFLLKFPPKLFFLSVIIEYSLLFTLFLLIADLLSNNQTLFSIYIH
jgi:hypothetical protein